MAHLQQLNWSYFKPEYSGKPEEDAEKHLLRTNDWMETHNFPDDQKVRRLCLTLMGEPRLWYETLGTAQLDWETLRDCFRQQHTKFGSIREQYFHAWRSFQFDENTDIIDSYMHKVKQVATILNYGKPQILELFKNTLPSRLYYMVYNMDNLRKAVETTKCMLTKEQIDGCKSGQSAASPFRQVNQQNPKRKGVTFNVIETIQKQGDSIDKLTSIMNELSTKLDRKDNSTQYKPRIHPGRNRGCRQRQNRYYSRDRLYSRERGPYSSGRNRRNYQNNNNYGNGSYRPRNGDYQTNNRQNDRSNYRRQNFNQNYGQRNRNRSVSRDHQGSSPRHRSTLRDISINRYRTNQHRSRDRGQRSQTTSREREVRSRSRSSSHVSTNRDRSRCYRCNEYDHFARECPNVMSDDGQVANLQMPL